MNPREIFRRALEDPRLEILVLAPPVYETVARIAADLPEGACVSEWRHTLVEVSYEYHIHGKETATALNDLIRRGIHGGHPKLVRMYTPLELVNSTK